jgi:hypothetical protein
MREAFDVAEVSSRAIARLEPTMTNHPKDRHVLAAAVASPAHVVVTFNLRDFPSDACEPFGIEARDPDTFLVYLYGLNPELVRAAIEEQASDLENPRMSVDEVLDGLAVLVPSFAASVRGG